MGNKLIVLLGVIVLLLFSCTEERVVEPIIDKDPVVIDKDPVVKVAAPLFNEDSAYQFIQDQVNFGPRVPNTKAHIACGDYLVNKLKGYGAEVIEQKGQVKAFNNAVLNIRNIIGRFNPQNDKRIMLFAHWDTRPFADRDNKNQGKPIDGANDGASGVGVLLEIARLIQLQKTNMGIDIIFFDAEDYGSTASNIAANQMTDDWCLGAQYWAKNPPVKDYRPRYGILLDMVGASDAVFPKEYLSMYFAQNVVEKVWKKASELGHGSLFVNQEIPSPGITDDHRYVNILAKIPSIDIIHYDMKEMDFGSFHHTHEDNMSVIDKTTLKAVGQTVTEVIYQEKP